MEMLIAMDRQWTLLGKARADAVGAFTFLAPHRSGPQPPGTKSAIIAGRTAPLDRNAVPIGKQHATSDTADCEIQPIEARLGGRDERFDLLASMPQLVLGKCVGRGPGGRIEPIQ